MVRDMRSGVEVRRGPITGLNLVGIGYRLTILAKIHHFTSTLKKYLNTRVKDLYGGLPGHIRAPTLNSDLNIQVLLEDTCSTISCDRLGLLRRVDPLSCDGKKDRAPTVRKGFRLRNLKALFSLQM